MDLFKSTQLLSDTDIPSKLDSTSILLFYSLMAYTSDLEEYSRLRQVFQLSSEQLNYHPGTSAMQPPASAAGQSPVLPTDWPLYDLSMGHASASLDPNWTIHTTMCHPAVDNLYQSDMHSFSTRQNGATKVGIEDHLSPGQTIIQTQSSTLSPSTHEPSPPNRQNIEIADMEATSAHGELQKQDESDLPFKCLWDGCKSRKTLQRKTFSSHASLMRHIKEQHVAHRSVRCPECGQSFGRLDNMKEHRGRRHRMFD
ncbi:unnamed protein product [Penicillium egyptiacum]|uniref:C2H2-type domain-containing protein n=1 Tax=Penicillium egyptiacum TaxID=1303716 RepID=A0A9W4P356_9EURO|nr:unnamed protein product [Penicillium egyptiacum]